MTPAGFPHSDIHGSRPAFGYPWLFVDRYVLHRLPVPRHPPCALSSLTFAWRFPSRLCRAPIMLESLLGSSWQCSGFSLAALAHRKIIVVTLYFCLALLVVFLYSVLKVQVLLRREVVGSNGFEPSTSRLSGVRSNHLSYEPMFVFACGDVQRLFARHGGDEQNRTVDPLLARQVLSQLSYTPVFGRALFAHP